MYEKSKQMGTLVLLKWDKNLLQMPAWPADQESVLFPDASQNNTKLRKQREVHLERT